ncbi:MAG: 2-oxo acid dehydrogenase subunit E2 [Treponema sp.]|nr:2-oxo acid dehydrogenase subunit E2 [Treponema sp.]
MAHILIMPRQGNTVESCIIGEWKVKEGDPVQTETPVCVVETDKATFEVLAGSAGTVLKILRAGGDDVPVLEPIMVIGQAGENWEAALPTASSAVAHSSQAAAMPGQPAAPDAPVVAANQTASDGQAVSPGPLFDTMPISPRARELAEAETVNLADLSPGSGPGGRVIEQDVRAYLEKRPPLTKTAKDKLRKRIAQGLPSHIEEEGKGIGGKITADELETVFSSHIMAPGISPTKNKAEIATIANICAMVDEFTDAPIKGIRKLIADQMMKSHNTTAAFTLNSSALAVKLQELRSRFKDANPELGLNKITINDLVLFAVSRVLPDHPYMNAHKLDGSVRSFKNVNLGNAVSTSRGLMVPVIRNADRLSLRQISERAKELADACRNGSVSPDDLHGSTFTVSNRGNNGIERFSPIINIPEIAILGVCSIVPKPAEISPGRYEILPCMGLSLTIDHAVVDGAPAAVFLKELCGAIKDIDLWIIKECIA